MIVNIWRLSELFCTFSGEPQYCFFWQVICVQLKSKKQTMNTMKEKPKYQTEKEIKYQLAGWVLFVICSLFFIASSLKNNDVLTFIGGTIFLIACIVFIIPLLRPNKRTIK